MVTTPQPKRKATYDEDLLVRLIAESRLTCRQIAEQVHISHQMVSDISRGTKRRDLYERICQQVEAAHRRAQRRAADSLWDLVDKHVKEALEGTGETARKCREFLIRTFLSTPDPAGRYVGLPRGRASANAKPLTSAELDLLAVVRGGDNAPKFKNLPQRIQSRIAETMGTGTCASIFAELRRDKSLPSQSPSSLSPTHAAIAAQIDDLIARDLAGAYPALVNDLKAMDQLDPAQQAQGLKSLG